ncbi:MULTISPECIES: sulfatase [unclassified Oceanispirochaeta]|uniref:sulfatase family protein n=1 Tax=unclassified Oceanispirochaeta TaxID=2635722 RepID=UPI000E08ED54|nr:MULTISPECIES: sulfatase-like hydrolase/transferase [unclassified Oceanispirochaeta]MBF9018183.1 sulfatase-like hydrolase/transferase [Oceanispirochaeta sp. M2]NPD74634.1 sulfatase-like hydrolase/transferase [Oceanispirochaeta sp. M1]RDG29504.1 hypothetical protein DV872_21260 [Oceanispirochaeta sp. M1]
MRPNILLLFPDQWRPAWLEGESEIPLRTGNLKELKESGCYFSNAISPSPLCAPARAALATGMKYHNAGVKDNTENLPLDSQTFYKELRDSGYEVLGCGKFDLHKPAFIWGTNGKNLLEDWGFSSGIDSEGKIDAVAAYKKGSCGPYITYLKDQGVVEEYISNMEDRGSLGTSPSILKQEQYGDDWVCRNGLKLIENSDSEKPWFLQVNFTGPHLPFDITEKMAGLYKDINFPVPENGDESIDHMQIRRCYAAMMDNIDSLIGGFIEKLEERGDLKNTVIVFASDHGEMLGDRGHYGKCLPYNPSLGIPMIFSGPGIKKGAVNNSIVELIDLYATILEAAAVPISSKTDSRSLWPILSGKSEHVREHGSSSLSTEKGKGYDWRLVLNDNYKLIEWKDGKRELYSRSDFSEKENLIENCSTEAELLAKELPPWYRDYSFPEQEIEKRGLHE